MMELTRQRSRLQRNRQPICRALFRGSPEDFRELTSIPSIFVGK